jgi:hypothetical protein
VRGATTPDDARDALQRLRYALPGAGPAPAVPAAAPVTTAASAEALEAAAPAATGSGARDSADEEGVVPIETLLFAGDEALREALALRGRIAQLAGSGPGTPLGDALDELFGLVELGLAARS